MVVDELDGRYGLAGGYRVLVIGQCHWGHATVKPTAKQGDAELVALRSSCVL